MREGGSAAGWSGRLDGYMAWLGVWTEAGVRDGRENRLRGGLLSVCKRVVDVIAWGCLLRTDSRMRLISTLGVILQQLLPSSHCVVFFAVKAAATATARGC